MKYDEEAVNRLIAVCRKILCYLPKAYDGPGPHGQLVKAIKTVQNTKLPKYYYHDSEPVEIRADLPHKRNGGKWRDPETKRRMEFYLGWLVALGMTEADAQCMMGDLYWDCHTELELQRKEQQEENSKKL
jgi:hypothetical protein